MSGLRSASHAGSWYSSDKVSLSSQLTEWLSAAQYEGTHAQAIIVPHAGYRYSGPCAAFSFKQINPMIVKRIFIIGPSHHLYIGDKCSLTCLSEYETPFYNLKIDSEVYDTLSKTEEFSMLKKWDDEAEHSVEMQLPFIAKVMDSHKNNFTIVPILTGNLSPEKQMVYGKILGPYLLDSSNLFVISSDFCHWGKRFRYQYYDKEDGEIWQSIEKLDHMGMDTIQNLKLDGFNNYLEKYGNTICGRRGIGILLAMIESNQLTDWEIKFLKYAQSSHCKTMDDSSVSYVAAALVPKRG